MRSLSDYQALCCNEVFCCSVEKYKIYLVFDAELNATKDVVVHVMLY